MSKEIDITEKRFGYLTVIKKNGYHIRKSGRKDVLWECKCDCGNIVNITKSNLARGYFKVCLCKDGTHKQLYCKAKIKRIGG